MADTVALKIDGQSVEVPRGCTVSAAIVRAGIATFRRSVSGENRAPLCGMGVCFECRVTVNGNPHTRSCQLLCQDGMEVQTGE
jgi:sarcosine oxidase subunit alpha